MSTATAPRAKFNYPTTYLLGCGRRRELADQCKGMKIARPLVITDPGLAGLPWFTELVDDLRAHGLAPAVFSAIQGNPVEKNVTDGVLAYHAHHADGCVLIGGGSALDAGKCIAVMVGHPGHSVFDFEDVGDNWLRIDPAKIAPMIALPTTSGTGSEVGRAGVITDERDHTKKIIFHPRMLPPLVIADPETTFGLPPHITAATGVDAFVHCFEAFCAPGYHPMAEAIGLEGMRLVQQNLVACFQDPLDAVARTHMMVASSMGATAFQRGLGLVHAIAHPLGATVGIHHGLANAILLPFVMQHNRPVIEAQMERLASYLSLPRPGFAGVFEWVLGLRAALQIPHTLADANIPALHVDMAPMLADAATRDPSLGTNPKECSTAEIEQVIRAAFAG
ncbi:MAG TPA: iron-containing alcohol dehydrogenase [Nannocystaceae bacterium]|nr:iron-containing alcohol dehydrogenase [Nannocystaceae bacterium]